MEPLISVIIPIYNMELYLARCLDSIINNTYRNLEIICVDDGSKDSSAEILRAYAEKDSRIVAIFKENGGVSSARNAGLDRMTGEYVTFVDPDDYVHPQYVELLYRAQVISGTRISICGFQIVDDDATGNTSEVYSLDNDEVCVYSFIKLFKTQNLRAYCWGKLIRSELVNNHQFREDLKLAEDTVFVAQVCEGEEAKQAAVFFSPLYYYYQREGSAVKTAKMSQLLQFGAVFNQLLRESTREDIYLDKVLKWYLSVRYLSSHIYFDREAVRECRRKLRTLRRRVLKTYIYGIKEKAALFAFILFPLLYWLYRIIKDPSMWAWEKVERKKRREAQKNEGT